jgi:electron transfer flavoprotein beta subunit
MHIIVCIKQVPDTTQVRISREGTLVREGIPSVVNPHDLHAAEAAVSLKKTYGARVTALTMGPPQAREALREIISLGADDAVLISDRAYAGSDTLASSYILAGAISHISRRERVDLVICGKQSIDGDTAQVGPGIAHRLGLTQLTYVKKVREVDPHREVIIVERRLEQGVQVVEGRLPALLTVEKECNEVRYAPLPNLIRAAKYEPEILNQEVLGLDKARIGLKGSPTKVRKIFAPPPAEGGEILAGPHVDPRSAAKALVDKLEKIGVLAGGGYDR